MNTKLQKGTMDTTILNDPGFRALPKGVRRMLVASEAYFFDQPAPHLQAQGECGNQRSKRANENPYPWLLPGVIYRGAEVRSMA